MANEVRIPAVEGVQDGTKVETPPEGNSGGEEKLFAGKYKSAEDLEKGYIELFKKLGATGKETPTPKGEENKDKNSLEIPEGTKVETPSGESLNIGKYEAEYMEKGSISEESYKELLAKGIDKNTVDAYIEGRVVIAEQRYTKLMDSVGGYENFENMRTWATENLSATEKKAFNEALTKDLDTATLALTGLYSKFTKATPPNMIHGDSGGSVGGDVFKSTAELTKAMSDPRYKKDPAYVKAVQEKLARSPIM